MTNPGDPLDEVTAASLAASQMDEHRAPEVRPPSEVRTLLSVAALEVDRLNGTLLWGDIERRQPEDRLGFLRSSPRHQTFGVFQAGLTACRRLSQRRPDEAVGMAQLLLLLVERIDLMVTDPQPLRNDLRAEAALALVQAKRAAADFQGAESALGMAEGFLAAGTQDRIDRALFCLQEGSLLADLGHFEEAIAALDTAAALFRRAGDRNRLGKVRLHQALILRHVDPARALTLAEEGLTLLDLEKESRAEASAHYTMAYCQAELGEADEADSILATYQYLIAQQEESVRTSFEWLKARIRFRQSRRAEGEQILRTVHEWYLERSFRFEAVLTAIDLAEMLVEDDRMGEAVYWIAEILPILDAWGLHRDSLAVVILLREGLEAKALESGAFQVIADQIRRTWHRNGRAGLPAGRL
jgi:tetratricopeptide (TPR) repeat protein